MKMIRTFLFALLTFWTSISFAQENIDPTTDSTGLAGDHFSLQGAMDLFKASNTLEDFEKKLNTEDNAVNNLDLNNDDDIDYIQVIDNKKDNAHAIILRVAVSATEDQDVAVIELGKDGAESAMAQIVGDDELYGDSTIVEPADDDMQLDAPVKGRGPCAPEFNYFTPRIVVNVWGWPCVKHVYGPAYVVFVSPYHWHSYPPLWKPWKHHPWYWHHQHCMHYHAYYHPCYVHRINGAHMMYAPMRRTSIVVKNHYAPHRTAYYAHRTAVRKNGGIKHGNGGGGGMNGPKDGGMKKGGGGGMKKGGGNVKQGGGGMKGGGKHK